MIEISIEVSGSNYSPENDGHEPETVGICHKFSFSQADNPLTGPTTNAQVDLAMEIAAYVRGRIKQ